MEILNIGPVELILILLIMFILLGPEGMVKTARQIGIWIRKLIRSPIWKDIMGYSREIRDLPTKLVRETGLDEDIKEIRKTTRDVNSEINQTIGEAKSELNTALQETGATHVAIPTKPGGLVPPDSDPAPDVQLSDEEASPPAEDVKAASTPPDPSQIKESP